MPKLKTKRKLRIKTPKSKPEVIDASTLNVDALFEEVIAPEKRDTKQAKRRKKHAGEDDEGKRSLIKRIKKIYRENGFHNVSDLGQQSAGQLRNHLNHLQWGLADWITRKGLVPDPPDEFPENGFRCVTPTHKVWTNSTICQMRTMYSSLYPSCSGCDKWRDHATRDKADSGNVLS